MSAGHWFLMFCMNSAFKMSGIDYLVMQHHMPEDRSPQPHCCEHLMTCIFNYEAGWVPWVGLDNLENNL
jgi:hypothetical protein